MSDSSVSQKSANLFYNEDSKDIQEPTMIWERICSETSKGVKIALAIVYWIGSLLTGFFFTFFDWVGREVQRLIDGGEDYSDSESVSSISSSVSSTSSKVDSVVFKDPSKNASEIDEQKQSMIPEDTSNEITQPPSSFKSRGNPLSTIDEETNVGSSHSTSEWESYDPDQINFEESEIVSEPSQNIESSDQVNQLSPEELGSSQVEGAIKKVFESVDNTAYFDQLCGLHKIMEEFGPHELVKKAITDMSWATLYFQDDKLEEFCSELTGSQEKALVLKLVKMFPKFFEDSKCNKDSAEWGIVFNAAIRQMVMNNLSELTDYLSEVKERDEENKEEIGASINKIRKQTTLPAYEAFDLLYKLVEKYGFHDSIEEAMRAHKVAYLKQRTPEEKTWCGRFSFFDYKKKQGIEKQAADKYPVMAILGRFSNEMNYLATPITMEIAKMYDAEQAKLARDLEAKKAAKVVKYTQEARNTEDTVSTISERSPQFPLSQPQGSAFKVERVPVPSFESKVKVEHTKIDREFEAQKAAMNAAHEAKVKEMKAAFERKQQEIAARRNQFRAAFNADMKNIDARRAEAEKKINENSANFRAQSKIDLNAKLQEIAVEGRKAEVAVYLKHLQDLEKKIQGICREFHDDSGSKASFGTKLARQMSKNKIKSLLSMTVTAFSNEPGYKKSCDALWKKYQNLPMVEDKESPENTKVLETREIRKSIEAFNTLVESKKTDTEKQELRQTFLKDVESVIGKDLSSQLNDSYTMLLAAFEKGLSHDFGNELKSLYIRLVEEVASKDESIKGETLMKCLYLLSTLDTSVIEKHAKAQTNLGPLVKYSKYYPVSLFIRTINVQANLHSRWKIDLKEQYETISKQAQDFESALQVKAINDEQLAKPEANFEPVFSLLSLRLESGKEEDDNPFADLKAYYENIKAISTNSISDID